MVRFGASIVYVKTILRRWLLFKHNHPLCRKESSSWHWFWHWPTTRICLRNRKMYKRQQHESGFINISWHTIINAVNWQMWWSDVPNNENGMTYQKLFAINGIFNFWETQTFAYRQVLPLFLFPSIVQLRIVRH